jgi:hypothetical protein
MTSQPLSCRNRPCPAHMQPSPASASSLGTGALTFLVQAHHRLWVEPGLACSSVKHPRESLGWPPPALPLPEGSIPAGLAPKSCPPSVLRWLSSLCLTLPLWLPPNPARPSGPHPCADIAVHPTSWTSIASFTLRTPASTLALALSGQLLPFLPRKPCWLTGLPHSGSLYRAALLLSSRQVSGPIWMWLEGVQQWFRLGAWSPAGQC